jgi:hypothetical protein
MKMQGEMSTKMIKTLNQQQQNTCTYLGSLGRATARAEEQQSYKQIVLKYSNDKQMKA